MSPAGNFTLHAILAAFLAALAASSAAAGKPAIDNEGHAYLTIHLMGGQASGQGQQLEVQSYHWGALPSGSDPQHFGNWIADVERPAAAGGGQNELGMDYTAGKEKARQGHSMLGASERVTVGGAQTESGTFRGRGVDIARVDGEPVNSGGSGRVTGLATDPAEPASGLPTGKRQHKPFTVTKPLDKGSVWIRVSTPWAGCRVGARYPSLTLAGQGKTYVLQDVIVGSCGGTAAGDDRPTEEVAFYYSKIVF